jgi:hypothetical protein
LVADRDRGELITDTVRNWVDAVGSKRRACFPEKELEGRAACLVFANMENDFFQFLCLLRTKSILSGNQVLMAM